MASATLWVMFVLKKFLEIENLRTTYAVWDMGIICKPLIKIACVLYTTSFTKIEIVDVIN